MAVVIVGIVQSFYAYCFHCNARLMFSGSDIAVTEVLNDDRTVKFRLYTIKCPSCNGTIRVNG